MARARTELRILERLDGRGRIFDGDRMVAEVGYSLKEIEEDPMTMREASGHARVIETRALCGFVTPADSETIAAYKAKPLTFELEDGRRFDCVLTRVTEGYCLLKELRPFPA